MNETQELNGWQNLGKVMKWVRTANLTYIETTIYLYLAERTVGYSQSTSKETPYSMIASETKVSVKTVGRTMPSLINKGFIVKVASNQTANIGKVGYKYKLNYTLDNFPFVHIASKSNSKREITKLQKKLKDLESVDMGDCSEDVDIRSQIEELEKDM